MYKLQQAFEALKINGFFDVPEGDAEKWEKEYTIAKSKPDLRPDELTLFSYSTDILGEKLKFLCNGDLKEQPCLCCLVAPSAMTQRQKAIIWKKYHDWHHLSGYHCNDP